jgi:hypothetical protein
LAKKRGRRLYVIDSSVWIHIGRYHPPDIFVSLWTHIDESIASGLICSPDEVLRELKQGHDTLAAQLTTKVGLFHPLDANLQASVTDVLANCPTLIDLNLIETEQILLLLPLLNNLIML